MTKHCNRHTYICQRLKLWPDRFLFSIKFEFKNANTKKVLLPKRAHFFQYFQGVWLVTSVTPSLNPPLLITCIRVITYFIMFYLKTRVVQPEFEEILSCSWLANLSWRRVLPVETVFVLAFMLVCIYQFCLRRRWNIA